jgi:hypothetical protein
MSALRDTYYELLKLADALLKYNSPLADFELQACLIDDNVLRLKIWGDAIKVDNGSLERAGFDDQLGLVLRDTLNDTMERLETVEKYIARDYAADDSE